MKIVQIISRNKKTKRLIDHSTGKWIKPYYKAKKGCAECIVEVAGKLVTRHCVRVGR